MNCFEQNGFAAVSHVVTTECKELFLELEKQQSEFLSQEENFRSEEYARKWPADALHWWSRCWEYPFVMYHLKRLQQGHEKLNVLDLGSGVTFFPIAVARQNLEVCAVDVDELVAKDLPAASRLISPSPGAVSVSLSDGNSLPNADAERDIIYSISVLEHLDNFEKIISEVHRVLKPNGHFILTIDVDVKGDVSIGSDKFYAIMRALQDKFVPVFSNSIVHPQDLLTTVNTPYPMASGYDDKSIYLQLKGIVKQMLGYKKREASELACYGAVLRKTA